MYMAFQIPDGVLSISRILGLSGVYAICRNPAEFYLSSRRRFSLIPLASAALGIVYSHFILLLHKISPFGNYASGATDAGVISLANGWVDYYRLHFRMVFPSIESNG
jgi:hypothetical protein